MAKLNRVYPHEQMNINDYSGYSLDMAEPVVGTRFMQFITADKGRDNQLLTFTSLEAYVKELGIPVFSRHGQAARQAFEIMRSGGAVNVMRVTAEDATYANVMVIAKTKKELNVPKVNSTGAPLYLNAAGEETTEAMETDGTTPTTAIVRDVLKIKYEVKNISALKNVSDIQASMNSEYKEVADVDGYKAFPLFVIYSTGRGDYGNKIHFRFAPNMTGDKERDHRTALMESFVNEGSLTQLEETREVSLYPDAIAYNSSEAIEQVVAEEAIAFKVKSSDVHYDALIQELRTVVAEDVIAEADLDLFFGLDRLGKPEYQIQVEDTGVDFTSIEGIKLSAGSEGAFALISPTRQDAIDARIKDAIDGKLDEAVFNIFSHPTDMLLDANYPQEVKNSLVALRRKRNDFLLVLDQGIVPTAKAAMALREVEFDYDDFMIHIVTESGMVKDDVTRKNILVTDTFNLASIVPTHDREIGKHVPIAGPTHGIMPSFIEGTQKPVVNVPEVQDAMYEERLNISDVYKGKRFYDMQLTTQKKLSDLSHTNNVRVLLSLKRDIEVFAKEKRYSFTDPDNINKFMLDCEDQVIRDYIAKGYLQGVKLNISQTEREARQKILNWSLDINFRGFVIYNVIDLNIR